MAAVYLAAEDALGLALGRRLLKEHPALQIFRENDGRGFGRLRSQAGGFDKMARRVPVILFTDLDRYPCPGVLFQHWNIRVRGLHPDFLFRVCVREAEAWVLADARAASKLMGIAPDAITHLPEQLSDPKAELLRLAQRSPRAVRDALLPRRGSKAKIGTGYNRVLGDFVETKWDPHRAAIRSPSLERAMLRIAELSKRVGGR